MKYLRLIRFYSQTGAILLFLPCLFGLIYSSCEISCENIIWQSVLFLLGAFFARSAGCVANDIADYKIDAQVQRTALRPIASGEISRTKAAIVMILFLLGGLGVLLLLPLRSIIIVLLFVPLVAMYPYCKRFFCMPQLVLGFVFSSGVLVASIKFDVGIWILYIISVMWVILYDTVYAKQDMVDDIKIGVKSSALLFGHTNRFLYILVACIATLMIILGVISQANYIYYIIDFVAVLIMIYSVLVKDGAFGFKINVFSGALMVLALIYKN